MADNEIIFDAWTPMSFKRALGTKKQAGMSWASPSWVGEHARRLMAYKVLQAYQDNSARVFLGTTDQSKMDDHREYGDASLIVNQVVAALLGESQDIIVDGAEDFNPDAKTDTTDSADTAETNADAERASSLQEWLREWAGNERLQLKMIETERNAVGLGDGVYVLGFSPAKGRPRLRVFDPGFYFPVLTDGNEDDYPPRVHIAWEMESDEPGKRKIRRITWELLPIAPANREAAARKLFAETPVPLDGDTLNEDGTITRQLPWNDKPTAVTCYMTDAIWTVDLTDRKIDDLSGGRAEYLSDGDGEIRDRDLMIDFIPVIHMPNTVAIANHYGRSSLATVLQILDDLANADTDLQAASSTTGKPVIALSGATMGNGRPTYQAGEIFETGDGTMTVLDTSRALDALIKYVEFLLSRVSTNSRVPESVLGRIKPSEVPSGVALALSFGPLASMVAEMRLVRDEKYPLLLKFAHRLALAGQADNVPPDWIPAKVDFGSFLPQDQAAAVTLVKDLLSTKPAAISLETAVKILMAAGLPIEDAVEEVQRIQERDFTGADDLLTATGDEDAVFEYLNRKKPAGGTNRPAPVVVPPGAPPTPVPPGPAPQPTPPTPGA